MDQKIKPFSEQIQALVETDKNFPQKLKQRLVFESSKVANPFKFIVELFNEGALSDEPSDPDASFGLKEMMVQLAITIACSKDADAVGGLMKALEGSGNSQVVSALRTWTSKDLGIETNGETSELKVGAAETCGWLESSLARKKNYPIAVKSLATQQSKEESKAVRSSFFQRASLPDELSKLATFKCQSKSSTKGVIGVQFDKNRMMACSTDGTLSLWNWRGIEEGPINIAVQVKNITCFQFDEEILVLGAAEGVVHLFDARTLLEEEPPVELADPVISLKFVESTLVILTRSVGYREQAWWIDICRPDMRLLNPRSMGNWEGLPNEILGVCMDSYTSLVHRHRWAGVYDTKSGSRKIDRKKNPCYLWAPVDISMLLVGDFLTPKRVVVAGCTDGMIAIWNTSIFRCNQKPVNTFSGHTKPIVSLCHLKGKLLSLDQSGTLFMWSGQDLVNENATPAPRVLVENSNMTSLVAHKRWFVYSSSKDDVIDAWTLPDSWLRTG